MQTLYNHSGELIAYHFQNILIHPEDHEVIGLVLGNCVYDSQAKFVGKLFQQKVYNTKGEILASEAAESVDLPADVNFAHCITDAWQITTMVKDHACPWVDPLNTWAKNSLAESLYGLTV